MRSEVVVAGGAKRSGGGGRGNEIPSATDGINEKSIDQVASLFILFPQQ